MILNRAIQPLIRPLSRLLLRTVALDDPWERFVHPVPLHRYGAGARREFEWYFEGESRVEVTSVEEVRSWLLTCDYARDLDLFNTRDFWQHPQTFEHLQKGDCEDFSLWAWRKLVELGYDAEFMAGQCLGPDCHPEGHTWVVYRQRETRYLFDTVLRSPDAMIQPLSEVRTDYLPEVSVDRQFNRYAFGGYYQQLLHRG